MWKISSFQQQHDETVPEAWKHFQDYILECPHHGIDNWLLNATFYHGLSNSTRETMDAAAGGAFLSLTISQATALVENVDIWERNKELIRKHTDIGEHFTREIIQSIVYIFFTTRRKSASD